MNDLLQIRVTGDAVADLFTNGEKHYVVKNALPHGYTFEGALRDPIGRCWIFVFKSEVPKENNELFPTFEYIK